MAVYRWLYLIIFLYAGIVYLNKSSIEDKKSNITRVSFVLIIALLALRHPYMGYDIAWGYKDGYWDSFLVINNKFSWSELIALESFKHYEKGFLIFNKVLGSIWNEPQFLLIACAVLSLVPIAIYTEKRSEIPLLSVVVFLGLPLFHIFFSGLRQGLAIGITVASMFFVEKKRPILFLLTVYLATLFHSSAIGFVIAYPLYYLKLNKTARIFSLALLPGIFVLRGPLFAVLSRIFKDNATAEATGGGLVLFLVFVMIYAFLAALNKTDEKEQNGLINLFFMACACQAFGGIYLTAMRVGYYFMVYAIIAIPNTMKNFKEIKIRYNTYYAVSLVALTLIFVLYGLFSIRTGSWSRTYPYFFLWNF